MNMKNKKGSALMWIVIIMCLIAIGVGVYFLLSSGSDGGIIGGSSIPKPPALPN